MTQAGPRVGQLYSCIEQSKMHGGNPRLTLPDSEDEVTLIRFRPDKNPDGPHIIEHGPPRNPGSRLPERVEMLRRQNEPLPLYRYASGAAWEYLGRYRVQGITDGGPEATERSKICSRPIRYVIRLEEAS
ncbi:MAG: hypothetical protein M3533_02420 [Actinomycetota bacterium]|nr:hypothetical protein [Actinomycetota bacterium]